MAASAAIYGCRGTKLLNEEMAFFREARPFGFILAPEGILAARRWENTILTLDYLGTLEHRWTGDLTTTFAWGGQSATSTIEAVSGYAETFGAASFLALSESLDLHDVDPRRSAVFRLVHEPTVPRSGEAFEDALEAVAEAMHERVRLQLLGPMAPYDFVGS